MKGNRAVFAVVALVVLVVAGWWLFKRARGGEPIDLIAQFESARKQPNAGMFSLTEATLNGERKKAIAIDPSNGTRLTWKVRIPNDAWLRVAVGLQPDAWDKPGDGVRFDVGVSDGRTFEPLFTQHLNPSGNPGDRRWIPVMVDLSSYAGEEVELIFNTRNSEPGIDDRQNDLALWGTPEVVIR